MEPILIGVLKVERKISIHDTLRIQSSLEKKFPDTVTSTFLWKEDTYPLIIMKGSPYRLDINVCTVYGEVSMERKVILYVINPG